MKRYRVKAVLTYSYAHSVSQARHRLCMTPAQGAGQSVASSTLLVEPAPARRSVGRNDFGAESVDIVLAAAHSTFQSVLEADVSVSRERRLLEAGSTCAEASREALQVRSLSDESPVHFLLETDYTRANAQTAQLVAESLYPDAPASQAALNLAMSIKGKLRYDTDATTVASSAADAMAAGGGVCQDFAHIMIAALRSQGIAARYASGYLRTVPPEGGEKLVGADGMHAWVSVWCGVSGGWVDIDPTNGCRVENDHIVVGYGRDYQDVSPIRGVFLGYGDQDHRFAVDVVELGPY